VISLEQTNDNMSKTSIVQLLSFTLFLSLFLVSCFGDNNEKEGCKYAPPTAIFVGVDSFENHSFTVNGQDGVERIYFPKTNMDIELYQSGCDTREQEFRFHIREPYPLNTPPEVCAMHIANLFYILSQQSIQQLGALQQFAEAIKVEASSFQYNEKLQFQGSHIKAQIDKTHQTESAILTILISE